MKKNRTMRIAALLLALVLITSCFAGGTFAKYTAEDGGEDAARAAKWGVTVAALNDGIFQSSYATDDEDVVSVIAESVVSADNVVAPGTSVELAADEVLNLSGTPEVAVHVDYALDLALDNWVVPVPSYTSEWVPRNGGEWVLSNPAQWIDAPIPTIEGVRPMYPGFYPGAYYSSSTITYNSDGSSVTWNYYYDWVETEGEPVDTFYCPLSFVVGSKTIKASNYASAEALEAAVEEAFAASIDAAPGTDLSTIEIPSLSWNWPYESGNDAYDTMLGNAEVPATIAYAISAAVTQID